MAEKFKKAQFHANGMVTHYIVIDSDEERVDLKDGNVVSLTESEYKKLRERFPKSFLPYEEPPKKEDDTSKDFDLTEMTVDQLHEFIVDSELDIQDYDKLKKPELIEAIATLLANSGD